MIRNDMIRYDMISDIDPLVLADPSEVIFDPSMIPQMQHNFNNKREAR